MKHEPPAEEICARVTVPLKEKVGLVVPNLKLQIVRQRLGDLLPNGL